ncbi:MAG: hypothetical protein ACM3U2_15190 [Deltaproteobacteria bacterium]
MLGVIIEFIVAASLVVVAGIVLARCADQIAEVTHLGHLVIGTVLLAAATSLPELTVDLSAVRQGLPDLAMKDLLGSSLMNLLILAVLDLTSHSRGKMLSRMAAGHALAGSMSIALTAIVGFALVTAGRYADPSLLDVSLPCWAILLGYVFGVRVVFSRSAVGRCGGERSGQGACRPGSGPGNRLAGPVEADSGVRHRDHRSGRRRSAAARAAGLQSAKAFGNVRPAEKFGSRRQRFSGKIPLKYPAHL